jgi:hypothetical protein
MQPHHPRFLAPILNHFLRLENPTICTRKDSIDLLRTGEDPKMVTPVENEPPSKIVTPGKRSLVFPMPGLSPREFVERFSDKRHFPLVDASPVLKEQRWFNTPATPGWISCDLALYPNDGAVTKAGLTDPDAATLTAIMIIALARKLPPMKMGFAKLMSSTLTDEGFGLYLCMHNGTIRYNPISRREAHRESVLKVTTVP